MKITYPYDDVSYMLLLRYRRRYYHIFTYSFWGGDISDFRSGFWERFRSRYYHIFEKQNEATK